MSGSDVEKLEADRQLDGLADELSSRVSMAVGAGAEDAQ